MRTSLNLVHLCYKGNIWMIVLQKHSSATTHNKIWSLMYDIIQQEILIFLDPNTLIQVEEIWYTSTSQLHPYPIWAASQSRKRYRGAGNVFGSDKQNMPALSSKKFLLMRSTFVKRWNFWRSIEVKMFSLEEKNNFDDTM